MKGRQVRQSGYRQTVDAQLWGNTKGNGGG